MTVSWRKQGSCGFVELNKPPVNAINLAIRQGLSEAVAWAESQQLSRVMVSGAGAVFAAGAMKKNLRKNDIFTGDLCHG